MKTIKAKRYKKFILDPNGFFVINIAGEKIIIDYYKGSRIHKRIAGNSAKEIRDTIDKLRLIKNFKHSIQHAIYLGSELQKAELAIKNNLSYIQDEELRLRRK